MMTSSIVSLVWHAIVTVESLCVAILPLEKCSWQGTNLDLPQKETYTNVSSTFTKQLVNYHRCCAVSMQKCE
jgi:hypothetical protein